MFVSCFFFLFFCFFLVCNMSPDSQDDEVEYTDMFLCTTFVSCDEPNAQNGYLARERYFMSKVVPVAGVQSLGVDDWEETVVPAACFPRFRPVPCPLPVFLRCIAERDGLVVPSDLARSSLHELSRVQRAVELSELFYCCYSVLAWAAQVNQQLGRKLAAVQSVFDKLSRTLCLDAARSVLQFLDVPAAVKRQLGSV